ncbi:MAG: dephospho-CoA kinase [Planctomycetaceae bacterium]
MNLSPTAHPVATTAPRPVLGLVGGVASGKSHLGRQLAQRRTIAIVDADRLGHEVLRDPQVRRELVELFGEQIVDPQGELSRGAVAALVFGTEPAAQERRRQLEAVTHPRIRAAAAAQLELARQDPACEGSVIDAALLLEAGWHEFCDAVVFVECPRAERLKRAALRGWSAEELERREASQWSLEAKRARADAVIENGPGQDGAAALERVWSELVRGAGPRVPGIRPVREMPA